MKYFCAYLNGKLEGIFFINFYLIIEYLNIANGPFIVERLITVIIIERMSSKNVWLV